MAKNNTKVTKTSKGSIVVNGALLDKTYRDADAVAAIKDAKLRGYVNTYIKEEDKGVKAAWNMVRLIGKMKDVIKKDFGSDAEFAAFMGMTQSAVNKRKRIAEYADKLEAAGYSVTNAFELLPVIGKMDKPTRIESFIDSLDGADATQTELREVVKTVKVSDSNTSFKPISSIRAEKEEEKRAKEAEKAATAKATKKSAPKVSEKAQTAKINATYIKYTLPWLERGQLIDKNVELSEADAKLLAKALMKILEEKRV